MSWRLAFLSICCLFITLQPQEYHSGLLSESLLVSFICPSIGPFRWRVSSSYCLLESILSLEGARMLCKLFLGFLALVPTIIFLGPPDRWASYLIPMTDPSLMTPPGKSLCLVTGASSGIGRDAVLALARAGFHVVAGVRNVADAEQFRENQKISHVVVSDCTLWVLRVAGM